MSLPLNLHIDSNYADVYFGINLIPTLAVSPIGFRLADRWRNPVQIYGDYLLAHTSEAVEIEAIEFPPLPAKD